jgi:tetratricopeptide (TPR) repeat protein
LELQRAIFLLGGISIVALVISDFRKHLDAGSALLGLWVLGVLVFASLFNWTINGRSVLPMLPAVGLLLARRLEPAAGSERGPQPAVLACGLGLAALTVLAVAAADYRLANSGREAAGVIASKYPAPANNLSFQGHWGFQYYLEKKGRRPLDVWAARPAPGELIAVPANDMHELPAQATRLLEVLEFRPNSWLTTLDRIIGVGFHSDFWGPLPFGVGHVEPERYYIFKVLRPFVFSSGTALLDPPEWKQEDQELAQCQAALRANPQDADAHFQAAVLLARQSQVPEAIAHWLEVVRLRPNDAHAHAQLGALYQAANRNRQARDQYYAALRIMPDSPSVLNNLAWLLATCPDAGVRDGKEAVRVAWRAAVLTLQLQARPLGTLAAAYAEAGRFSDAVTAAGKAIELAVRSGQKDLAETNRQLLELYRGGKAYREGTDR